ncbi:unnamed protein product [Peronospora destructor]|uniref:Integrase catalytic domain-containing protein n=1 Tax=Peronospora destructor TaxID=86335 RepID=A0AAV0VCS8_9STRA|nr:unnamed protein product [Peronospora destructor]
MCKDHDNFELYEEVKTPRSVSSAKTDAKLNVLAAASRGRTAEITRNECVVKHGNVPVATGRKQSFMMYLNIDVDAECHMAEDESELWHRRLGHASYSTINKMITDGKISGAEMKTEVLCDVCATAKQVRISFKTCEDVVKAREKARTDGVSQYVTVYPLRKKSDVPDVFAKRYREIKTATGTTIKVILSDNGGEYQNAAMDNFCQTKFIKQGFTVPYNPEQNEMAESMNRTLVDMT